LTINGAEERIVSCLLFCWARQSKGFAFAFPNLTLSLPHFLLCFASVSTLSKPVAFSDHNFDAGTLEPSYALLSSAALPSPVARMATFDTYPHELWHIKCLLLRKQYHPCINACLEVIRSSEDDRDDSHPLSSIFATFYLALSYHELARSMHEHSLAKLATFDTAERHYRQTIKLLPSLERCRSILSRPDRGTAHSELTSSLSLEHEAEPPARTASALAPNIVFDEKDDSDLESHDSFDDFLENDMPQITLPRRPLERDYSSMSLLTAPPRLTKSTSQGLLRPIRLGSPPKAYHLPPKLPYFGKDHSSQSSRSPSPLPRAPDITVIAPSQEYTPKPAEPSLDLTRLSEHLDGLHTQIKTHIGLLHRAKLATTVAQADRACRSRTSDYTPQKRMPQSKSFWSFTPVDVKLAETQNKIEEGRASGWQRKRYRPERYDALVDNALAEL
jgi:hypothetical protein